MLVGVCSVLVGALGVRRGMRDLDVSAPLAVGMIVAATVLAVLGVGLLPY